MSPQRNLQRSKAMQPHKTNLDTLAGRIRAILDARDITVTDAAKAVGVSRPMFSLYASGAVKKPAADKLVNFSKLTDISLDWLISRRGPDPLLLTGVQGGKRKSKSKRPTESEMPTTTLPDRGIPEIS